MAIDTAKKHPIILWAQRDNVLFLTAEVEDMKIEKLVCEGNKFVISGTNGSGTDKYEAELELYAPIKGEERRQIATARHVELVFPKEKTEWWPRLLKNAGKVSWIKVDFNKWVDEDEQKEEDAGFDFSNMGFPGGMDMFSGMGAGGAGGLGQDGDGGSSDEEEGGDDDMPPLEDAKTDASAAEAKSTEPDAPTSTATA